MKKILFVIFGLFPVTMLAQRDTTQIGLNLNPPKFNFLESIHSATHIVDSQWSYLILIIFTLLAAALIIADLKTSQSITNIFYFLTSTQKTQLNFSNISNSQRLSITILYWLSIILIPSYLIISLDKVLKSWPFLYLISAIGLGFVFIIILILNYIHFLITKVIYNSQDFGKLLIIEFKSFLAISGLTSFVSIFLIYFSYNIIFIRSIIYLSILLFFIFYIFKTYLQFQTFKLYKFSVLHFILYLCSVEILPILLALTIFKH